MCILLVVRVKINSTATTRRNTWTVFFLILDIQVASRCVLFPLCNVNKPRYNKGNKHINLY